ncbi:MAG: hypothetical protein V7K46_01185 [Nostoc sp.]
MNESFIFADESLILAHESLILADESLILAHESSIFAHKSLPRSQSLTGNAYSEAPPPLLAAPQLICISSLWLKTRF